MGEIMQEHSLHTLAELSIPSSPGNERIAMEQVADAISTLHLPRKRLEHLKTAVAEATMNAMEHGNGYRPDSPVSIYVLSSESDLVVRICDQGSHTPIPEPETPDLEAKIAERQSPRGWGLFLIKNLVDTMHVSGDADHHVVELTMHLKGEAHADSEL